MATKAAASRSRLQKPLASNLPRRQIFPIRLAVAITLLCLTAFYSVVSELSLRPVFGANSVPSQGHIFPITAITLGLLARKASPLTPAITILQTIPLHCFTASSILHYIVIPYTETLGLTLGAFAAQFVTLFPLLLLSCYSALALLDDKGVVGSGGTGDEIGLTGSAYLVYYCIRFGLSAVIPNIAGKSVLLTRWSLQYLTTCCFSALLPLRRLLFISPALVPALTFILFNDPHAPFESSFALANTTLNRRGFALLDRHESITGYISVVENLGAQFRALRCDHSLLGGVWLPTTERITEGVVVPETIYTVFTMLEAVRLMEPSAADGPASALVLGLGIGTSPAALVAQGVNTTVVEIDPVVTAFARRYFDLPRNMTVIHDDAKAFLRGDRAHYDMIIHDVFTGGVEPVNLFTADFLVLLKKSLKPGGKIAINYVGDPSSMETSLVLSGINYVFEGCKFFTDEFVDPTQNSNVVNIIAFCTKDVEEWHFRKPTEADFMKSQSRRKYLLPQYEIEPPKKTASGKHPPILSNMNKHVIQKNQPQQAKRHWEVMREIIPAIVWETW